MTTYRKPLPEPTPETRDYWEGARRGELRLQRCTGCAHVYFPPRPFCPRCASRTVEAFTASGKGRLHSYVINYRPAPGFEEEAPYSIAVVELEEGPRLMTNVVGVEQTAEALMVDMPLEVAFEAATEQISLPKFRPAGAAR
ncbi:MAG: Zn-ribbon domain-containing OB-fold protein [Gemmataceae bacterium]|nr:Zn-ribbon domain-containing OB-fold protein [Gemmataceae bacterium]